MKNKKVIGYKGFQSDLTCRGFQYEIGKTFKHDGDIKLCEAGFHFCKKIEKVANYYSIQDKDIRICEIEALGKVIEGNDKCVTDKIKIVRELTKDEMYELVNSGIGNRGFSNTGSGNTGDWNTGDSNTGYWNTGDSNTGDSNTGDWNKTNRSTGVFCNEEPKMLMFNKPTDMTYEEWKDSKAFDILIKHTKSQWISFDNMTNEEKKKYTSAEICKGYLKEIDRKVGSKEWWKQLEDYEKETIIQMPNFDLKIFNDIMELHITEKEFNEIKKRIDKND